MKGRGLGKWGLNISRSVNILDKVDIILGLRFCGRFLRYFGIRNFGKKKCLRNLYKSREYLDWRF